MLAAVLCLACTGVGCTGVAGQADGDRPAGTSNAATSTNPPDGCAETRPDQHRPEEPPADVLYQFGPPELLYGHDGLWASLEYLLDMPIQPGQDGLYVVKVPWWRTKPGVFGLTAQRLDGQPSPSAVVEVPDYGPIGFQASGVRLPSPGCWQVTGSVGDVRVTLVIQLVGK